MENKQTYTAGLILSIIGLVVSIINSILGVVMTLA